MQERLPRAKILSNEVGNALNQYYSVEMSRLMEMLYNLHEYVGTHHKQLLGT